MRRRMRSFMIVVVAVAVASAWASPTVTAESLSAARTSAPTPPLAMAAVDAVDAAAVPTTPRPATPVAAAARVALMARAAGATARAAGPAAPSPQAANGPAPAPRWPASPVYGGDFADPSIIRVGATYWAYATGAGHGNLQAMSSTDLRTWTQHGDPLPVLPAWAAAGLTWAPGVIPAAGGGYLLYYTARDASIGRQCISLASSLTPGGPFVDLSSRPLICQLADGGSIDPAPFVAPDGSRYLLWKSDDNALGHASHIGAARLSLDGRTLVGASVGLLSATEPWQAGVVEGPAMVAVAGHFYLLYGANHWDTPHAGIGYAVCSSPLGPCTDATPNGPWISTGWGTGPSGPDVFTDGNGTAKLAFHAWIGAVGYPAGRRALWITNLDLGSPAARPR